MATLSGTVVENSLRRPLARYHHGVNSGLPENIIISETIHDRGVVEVIVAHL